MSGHFDCRTEPCPSDPLPASCSIKQLVIEWVAHAPCAVGWAGSVDCAFLPFGPAQAVDAGPDRGFGSTVLYALSDLSDSAVPVVPSVFGYP